MPNDRYIIISIMEMTQKEKTPYEHHQKQTKVIANWQMCVEIEWKRS